ncbi:unnamed protein product [Dracunculus medinensis]|uniref:G_PROTEIN_RECEP_F1_2 domain-containing protein n=1 Tax=Dracunculus medinensis TaxID=318479 RepID=A0A0N4U2Z6_DRAME|nr:unnamed protein product [Dracunculus medinensis]
MDSLIIIYSFAEIFLSVYISLNNLLVLWVYIRSQDVRTITNTYIFSLSLTDFLSGAIGIPLTVYSVLTRAPRSYFPCLAIHLILCVLCTISTFHMLAIAIDKYIIICCKYKLLKNRSGRLTRTVILLSTVWVFGLLVAILPIFWFIDFDERQKKFHGECQFLEVLDYSYLVYVIFFGTIIIPTIIITYCYLSIYSKIREEESNIAHFLNGRERQRRVRGRRKLITILLIIVLAYLICWYPLYLINTVEFFFHEYRSATWLTLSAVVLSHVSCGINPLIYAYGMPGFKEALRNYFKTAMLKAEQMSHILRNSKETVLVKIEKIRER